MNGSLHYDRVRGVVELNGQQYASVDALAQVLAEGGQYGERQAAAMAGYGLAIAAHQWAQRPASTRLGAIIQAAEQLRSASPDNLALHELLDTALQLANDAVLRGASAEAVLADFVAAGLAAE